MKIKNRLFLSNILMIVMPVILTSIVLYGIMIIFSRLVEPNGFRSYPRYFDSLKELEIYVEKWKQNVDFDIIKADVSDFNKRYEGENRRLYIFHNNEQIYPSDSGCELIGLFHHIQDGRLIVVDKTAMFREKVGDYNIIFLDRNFLLYSIYTSANYDNVFINYGILTIMVVVIIIYLTNHFLIRFVYKGIETSLDSLAYGVNQIRDGNLIYRINYEKKDEFAQICSDFNEMASRLLDSVTERQKNEESRKELIVGISHDLRTPLTSIKAYVEGLEKGIASSPESQKRYLKIIQKKIDDLTHIVNQLFMFSKLDIGDFPFKLERLDICSELNTYVGEVSDEYAEKGLIINLNVKMMDMHVNADVAQLRNVFANILENSLKYKEKTIGKIDIICYGVGDYVVITFTDDGPGVKSDEVEKIFELFYQSDPARSKQVEGSGLGLAITAKILERLGGEIKAENIDSGGLAIVINLPRVMYTHDQKLYKK